MKVASIVALIASAQAAVDEGVPCVTATDCATASSECCNGYRVGHPNKKICWSPGSTSLSGTFTIATSQYYTKNCAVAVAGATAVAVQTVVSAISVLYLA